MTEQHNKQSVNPRLGISACLLGSQVRHDGGHCRNKMVFDVLSEHVDWMSVCPEVEMGMSVPRETIRLVQDQAGETRLIGNKSGQDYTEQMETFAERKLAFFDGFQLDGFLLKKHSPSCGMERVTLYNEKGNRQGKTSGLFAQALARRFPFLPMEEEGRLNDVGLREHFIERVYAHQRMRSFKAGNPAVKDLIQFHSEHKYQLLAHSEKVYRQLGRLVAEAGSQPFGDVLEAYERGFFECLNTQATAKTRSNVLFHLAGFLKKTLDGGDKRELSQVIDRYRRQQTPIAVPMTLIKHHFRKFPHAWVQVQHFLRPYPEAFCLRSYV